MKLNISKRQDERKSDAKKVRREGNIPAVLYSNNQPAEPVMVTGNEFKTALRQVKSGRLSTTIFTLTIDGKEFKALIKDIQYHPTTYDVQHIDFQRLEDKVPVALNVPIECIGMAECPGIKLGGFLRQVIRYVRVECLPSNIPTYYEVDVKDLSMRQSKRLSDIQMSNVRPLVNLKEVVVVIAKR